MKDKLTRESVLLFEKKGFSETSIQDIVDALNVTKGTFYYYFSSKEQLLMDIHLEYITNLLEQQQLILEDERTTQKEKLTQMIHLLIADIKDHGPYGRVFFREIRHLINENMYIIDQKRTKFRLNIEEVVRRGIEKKEFKADLKVEMITFGVLGVTNWTYNWFNPEKEVTTEQLVEIFADMILNGISN